MEWELSDQTLEVRYAAGYAHWDLSGRTANDILARYPNTTVEDGSPEQVQISSKLDLITIVFGVQRSSVTALKPASGSDKFLEVAPDFFKIVLRNFEIRTVTRVGHRSEHHLITPSLDDAQLRIRDFATRWNVGADLMRSTQDSRLEGKLLKSLNLQYEDDKTGLSIAVRTGENVFNLTGPHADMIRPHLPPPKTFVILDVDAYTKLPMPSSDFVVEDLVKSNLKMIRTRFLPLFETP
jgi:hypothetical protein